MTVRLPWRAIVRALCLPLLFTRGAAAQAVTSSAESQFNPEIDAHLELPSDLRLLGFAGLQQGEGYPYQQWYGGAALGFQFSRITSPHIRNIDPDKEFHWLFGIEYEYLKTTQTGTTTDENRVTLELTPAFRFAGNFLVRDRNLVELRWQSVGYSTTYRNMLSVERDFLVGGIRFAPYGSVEAFYDGSKRAWSEWWYTAGVQFSFGDQVRVDMYYRREDCSSCTPQHWNVVGLTLNFFFDVGKQEY